MEHSHSVLLISICNRGTKQTVSQPAPSKLCTVLPRPLFSCYQVPSYPMASWSSHFTSQIPRSLSAYEFLMQPVQKPALLRVCKPHALLSNCSPHLAHPQSFGQSKVLCRISRRGERGQLVIPLKASLCRFHRALCSWYFRSNIWEEIWRTAYVMVLLTAVRTCTGKLIDSLYWAKLAS